MRSSSGPPLLPGLIAASVCSRTTRPAWRRALTMPRVTVFCRPSAEPMAITSWPVRTRGAPGRAAARSMTRGPATCASSARSTSATRPLDAGAAGAAVVQPHGHDGGAGDDVIVGHDEVGLDEEAGAARVAALRPSRRRRRVRDTRSSRPIGAGRPRLRPMARPCSVAARPRRHSRRSGAGGHGRARSGPLQRDGCGTGDGRRRGGGARRQHVGGRRRRRRRRHRHREPQEGGTAGDRATSAAPQTTAGLRPEDGAAGAGHRRWRRRARCRNGTHRRPVAHAGRRPDSSSR